MLSVDWVTLLQNYGNILLMTLIHQTQIFHLKNINHITSNRQSPSHFLCPLVMKKKVNQSNYSSGVCKELETVHNRDTIKSNNIYGSTEKHGREEQSVLQKSEGATMTRSLGSFNHSPLAILVQEPFHLQTPYALLFPKSHSADVYSEDIT